jgi:hypothetical protein
MSTIHVLILILDVLLILLAIVSIARRSRVSPWSLLLILSLLLLADLDRFGVLGK